MSNSLSGLQIRELQAQRGGANSKIGDMFGQLPLAGQVVQRPATPFGFNNNNLLAPLTAAQVVENLRARRDARVTLSPQETQLLTNLSNRLRRYQQLQARVAALPPNEQQQFQNDLAQAEAALGMELETLASRANAPILAVPERNRTRIQPTGIFIPSEVRNRLPAVLERLERGEMRFEDLSQEHQNLITVRPTAQDVMPIPRGRPRDFFATLLRDGRVYPYTILPPHAYSNLNIPIIFQTHGADDRNEDGVSMTFDRNSLRSIYYRDPTSGQVRQGFYFSVEEGRGSRGQGGTNGLIVPANHPLVIIQNAEAENDRRAYIIQPRN